MSGQICNYKYIRNTCLACASRENFYTLAWTTLLLGDQKSNILLSGGIRGEVRMFHPNHKVCFYEWRPVDRKNIAVNSLVFHSEKPTWLFCKSQSLPEHFSICPFNDEHSDK